MPTRSVKKVNPGKSVESRLAKLERAVRALARQSTNQGEPQPWYIAQAGEFANDPIFDEIVRLGREYRRSLRPKARRSTNGNP